MSNQGRALISALNRGDYQAVHQFSNLSDPDIRIVNHHVHELFERAIRTENFKLFLALIKIPRVRVTGGEYCGLRHAVRQGLVEFVSEIVRVPSTNPNLPDRQGYSALVIAVRGKWSEKKALDMVRAMLQIDGIKLNLRGPNGKTALLIAMEKNWLKVASALVDAGAHPKMADKDGKTPLSLALTGDTGDLFGKMLTFDGDPPEEEADEFQDDDPLADDSAPGSPAAGGSNGRSPGITSVLNTPPMVQQVDPQVGHLRPQHDPPAQKIAPSTPPSTAASVTKPAAVAIDTADLGTVMEDQELDETLSKHFLFESTTDDPRLRLHRRAVLEHLEEIQGVLTANNNGLQASDVARTDPATGLSLWHVAALEGRFEMLLRLVMNRGEFPEPAALGALAPDGRGIAAILDENSALQNVLLADYWADKARHLAAFLSGLESTRKTAFGNLIARTNLTLLHGG